MRGIRIVPVFLFLLGCTYLGTLFVEANRDVVTVRLGPWSAGPSALGMVVLTSALAGMAIAGLFCSIEVLLLMWENRRLRRRIAEQAMLQSVPTEETGYRDSEPSAAHSDGDSMTRYTPL